MDDFNEIPNIPDIPDIPDIPEIPEIVDIVDNSNDEANIVDIPEPPKIVLPGIITTAINGTRTAATNINISAINARKSATIARNIAISNPEVPTAALAATKAETAATEAERFIFDNTVNITNADNTMIDIDNPDMLLSIVIDNAYHAINSANSMATNAASSATIAFNELKIAAFDVITNFKDDAQQAINSINNFSNNATSTVTLAISAVSAINTTKNQEAFNTATIALNAAKQSAEDVHLFVTDNNNNIKTVNDAILDVSNASNNDNTDANTIVDNIATAVDKVRNATQLIEAISINPLLSAAVNTVVINSTTAITIAINASITNITSYNNDINISAVAARNCADVAKSIANSIFATEDSEAIRTTITNAITTAEVAAAAAEQLIIDNDTNIKNAADALKNIINNNHTNTKFIEAPKKASDAEASAVIAAASANTKANIALTNAINTAKGKLNILEVNLTNSTNSINIISSNTNNALAISQSVVNSINTINPITDTEAYNTANSALSTALDKASIVQQFVTENTNTNIKNLNDAKTEILTATNSDKIVIILGKAGNSVAAAESILLSQPNSFIEAYNISLASAIIAAGAIIKVYIANIQNSTETISTIVSNGRTIINDIKSISDKIDSVKYNDEYISISAAFTAAESVILTAESIITTNTVNNTNAVNTSKDILAATNPDAISVAIRKASAAAGAASKNITRVRTCVNIIFNKYLEVLMTEENINGSNVAPPPPAPSTPPVEPSAGQIKSRVQLAREAVEAKRIALEEATTRLDVASRRVLAKQELASQAAAIRLLAFQNYNRCKDNTLEILNEYNLKMRIKYGY